MNSSDEDTQVFIVRLWCERREIEGARPVLRGTVEHVASGERRSVENLDDLMALFLAYQRVLTNDYESADSMPSWTHKTIKTAF